MNYPITKVLLVVTTPKENSEEMKKSLFEAGAGHIANYTNCSLTTDCIGSFKGNNNTNPYIGEKNKLEYVKEEKIEVICDIKKVKEVIKKVREIHPYEEPGINIIPLLNEEDL